MRAAALALAAGGVVGLPGAPAYAALVSPAPAPVLAGDPYVGERLAIETPGWPSGTAFEYAWFVDGEQVPGANGPDWELRPVDLGHVFKVAVTGSLTGFEPTTQESAPVTIVDRPLTAGTVAVAGTPRFGQTLTATPASWPSGAMLTYQWLRSGQPIAGATGPSYTAGLADLGAPLSVRATGSQPGHSSASATSAPTAAVAAATLAAGTVRTAGKAQVGRTLQARPSGFDAGAAISYRWLAGLKVVGTQTELRLTKKLAGKTVVLQATITKAGYQTTTVASAPVTVKKVRKPGKKGHGRG